MARVVITGIGILSPLGNTINDFWNNLMTGKSGACKADNHILIGKGKKVVGLLKAFDPMEMMSEDEICAMDENSLRCVYAARKAFIDAGIDGERRSQYKISISLGSVITNLPPNKRLELTDLVSGLDEIYPTRILEFRNQTVIKNLLEYDCLHGSGIVISSNCSAGINAIGHGFTAVKTGKAKMALVGGFELFRPFIFTMLSDMGFLTPGECRPFDERHDGMYMGEGTAMLILENADIATERGTYIYGEIEGFGQGYDAFHQYQFSPIGKGIANAVKLALNEATVSTADIDYIIADAKGIKNGDCSEAYGLRVAFNNDINNIDICSLKQQITHTLGASGPLSVIAGLLCLRENICLPTQGFERLDEKIDIPVTSRSIREKRMKRILVNAIGAGGNASSIIIRKWS